MSSPHHADRPTHPPIFLLLLKSEGLHAVERRHDNTMESGHTSGARRKTAGDRAARRTAASPSRGTTTSGSGLRWSSRLAGGPGMEQAAGCWRVVPTRSRRRSGGEAEQVEAW
ncbi:hypothetical protein E2562_008386 [Oryza meyeriana var. granulata]|uniref:Uncharacterized protein n=1 Tax=Oryza meyeriana var. granulata TaxID=110450 RepID=A0A6G1EGY5_9ORYZ|nr:hypothetical protein E2562_008386 [Oryza meyeriana var. granulata]